MNRERQPQHVSEIVEILSQHWENRREAAASRTADSPAGQSLVGPRGLTIAVSRDFGAQGTSVGRAVGARLGWPVYDHQLLERIASDMGVHTNLLESVDEKRVGWLEEAFLAFLAVPRVSENAYVQHLVKAILALGAQGECVVVGRGAAFILPKETTLSVRLTVPLKDRIGVVSRRLGISQADAMRQLEAIDRDRNSFVQDHFIKNPADLRNYDLAVDFSRFGVEGCAEFIVAAVQRLQVEVASH